MKMTKTQRADNTKSCKKCDASTTHTTHRDINGKNTSEKGQAVTCKIKYSYPVNQQFYFWIYIHQKGKHAHKKSCIQMFRAALILIAPNWKQVISSKRTDINDSVIRQ